MLLLVPRWGAYSQDVGKRGLSLTGVAFMTVLAVLESTLPSFCLSYKIQHNEPTVAVWTVWTVLAVSAVLAVSVMTAAALELNPPFRNPDVYSALFVAILSTIDCY